MTETGCVGAGASQEAGQDSRNGVRTMTEPGAFCGVMREGAVSGFVWLKWRLHLPLLRLRLSPPPAPPHTLFILGTHLFLCVASCT